jgi:hypothetical protein
LNGLSCPNCEGKIEVHFAIETGRNTVPREGDIGLCYDCGQPVIMTDCLEPLLDKSGLSWFERFQLGFIHENWSRKQGIHGS